MAVCAQSVSLAVRRYWVEGVDEMLTGRAMIMSLFASIEYRCPKSFLKPFFRNVESA
jgi:hypothetical protein